MAIPIKRTTPPPAAPEVQGVNFGSSEMYAAGGGLPEGNYIWKDVSIMMHDGFGQVKKGKPRLGVMITLVSYEDPNEPDRQQFYSMGSNADKVFAPNPETGKGLVVVPGAVGTTLNDSTNWNMLRKSLIDSGMPENILIDDCSVLDGLWVHMTNIPEPAERAGFTSKTGEASEERKNQTVAVVSEILEGGAPWEGGGGIPEAKPANKAPAKVPTKPAAAAPKTAKTTPKVNGKVEAPAEVAGESDEEAIKIAAINGVSAVLEQSPKGCARLPLKNGTFKAVQTAAGDDMADAVMSTYFANDQTLNALLGEVGYTVNGSFVKAL